MRLKIHTAALLLGTAIAATLPTYAAEPMSTSSTMLGALLDDPAAKAVLEKHAPVLVQGGQIEQARPITIKELQQYMVNILTDDVLKNIDADLAKIKK